ncbi:Ger(x)C family spore germination protein [Tumebacillus sp. DT12]|uniref:Ger(X)C family spore germination protein n=1 Tax=Tumebacillus lacus TaxID=2995335 RepID=A0ABT3WVZ2_9BACL|nr:Ger(x)C family spore germination protein [Tumebacillus lacus]MCX7568850.1 Ger(x)C family spore germination protein [Tumebacillus lacus]
MNIKSAFVTFTLLSGVLLSGCWDREEINDIALSMGGGIDWTEDEKLLGTSLFAIPSKVGVGPSSGGGGGGEGGGKKNFFVQTSTGENINDVFQKQQTKLSRRVFTSHRRVLVLGDRLAKHGIKNILDYYGRDPTTRLRTFVVVAKDSEAQEILKLRYPIERDPSEAIREIEQLISGTQVTIRDLMLSVSSEGACPIMAAIEPVTVGGSKEKTLKLSGTAVFKDDKLAGYLDAKETIGLQCLTNKLKNASLMATLPGKQGNLNVVGLDMKRKLKFTYQGDQVHIQVDLKGNGIINENNTNLDLSNPKNIQIMQNAVQKTLQKHIQQAIDKAQQDFQADMFGFGDEIHRYDPKRWKAMKDRWDEIFPKSTITCAIQVKITRFGMSGPPLQLQEQEVKTQ